MAFLKNINPFGKNPNFNPIGYVSRKLGEKRKEIKAEQKQHAKTQVLARKGQKMAFKKEMKAAPVYEKGLRQLQRQLEGQHKLPSDLGDIISRYQKAGKGAEEIFAKNKRAALHEFTQTTLPQVTESTGAESKTSSALNQALNASSENLRRNLESDYATMQNQLAQNLLGQSQQAKQFNQQNRGSLIQQAIGQPSAYTPPQFTAAPQSMWERFGPAATTGLGAVAGGIAGQGNPTAIAAGAQAGQGLGQSIFGR